MTAEGRARREVIRLRAAELFAQDVPAGEVARRFRVSLNAVYSWRRRWRADGAAGLVSKGPSGNDCKLSAAQQDQLAAALREGPAEHGYTEDRRWTLARVADLITELFGVHYTLRGVSLLLHRMGFSPQLPAHKSIDRDDEAVATWRQEAWQRAKS